jgi:hypothetical protein
MGREAPPRGCNLNSPLTRGLKVLNSQQCNQGGAAPKGTATEHGQSSSVTNKWIKEGKTPSSG